MVLAVTTASACTARTGPGPCWTHSWQPGRNHLLVATRPDASTHERMPGRFLNPRAGPWMTSRSLQASSNSLWNYRFNRTLGSSRRTLSHSCLLRRCFAQDEGQEEQSLFGNMRLLRILRIAKITRAVRIIRLGIVIASYLCQCDLTRLQPS